MMRFLEFMLSGAIGALMLSIAILLAGLLLVRIGMKMLSGRRWLAVGCSAPIVLLGLVLTVSSVWHSVRYVTLNAGVPPFVSFAVAPPQPGTIQQLPLATFRLDDGRKILLELDPYAAPNTVNAFIELAQQGFFDGYVFRRLEPDALIEVADPRLPMMMDLLPTPGYNLHGEFAGNGYANPRPFARGEIGLAMQFGFTAAPAAFFIMNSDATHYREMMPSFGAVIDGMDVVDEINRGDTVKIAGINVSLDPVRIESVIVDTFGVDYPPAIKLPDTPIRIQHRTVRAWAQEAEEFMVQARIGKQPADR